MKKLALNRRLSPASIVILAVLIIYCLAMLYPYLWALMSSFKTYNDFRTHIFALPEKWMWSNLTDALDKFYVQVGSDSGLRTVYLEEMFLNSFLYVFGCAAVSTLVPCLTAYVVANYKFAFGKVINFIVYMCMIIPIIGSLPSELQMTQMLGIYDTVIGMWFLKASFLGMYYLVFYALFENTPKDFAESAYMDGASNFSVMFHIGLPLAQKTMLIVFLLQIIAFWNDYTTPLMFLPSRPTVALGLYLFKESTSSTQSQIPMQFMACFIVTLPILVLFLIFRNKLIGNLSLGGLKE